MNRKRSIYLFSIIAILFILVQSGSVMGASNISAQSNNTIEIQSIEENKPMVDSIRKYVLYFESRAELENYVASHEVKRVYPNLKMVIVEDLLSKRDSLESMKGIKDVFDVTDTRYYQIEPPEDETYIVAGSSGVKLTQQTVDILNVSFLWDLGYRGSSIIAYDIDSGININHVDFQGRIMAESKSFITKENGYDHDDSSIEDTHGHGTHTAGIMAGAGIGNPDYIGMAPEAQILVGRLDSPAPPEAFIAAFEYALELQTSGIYVDVINLSWGGGDTEGQDAEEAMIRELFLNNILIACAAGNSGTNYYTVESPGAEAQSLTVAATKLTGVGQAYFSSVGPTADGYVKPDVAAPGMGIMSCGIAGPEDYVEMQGTSMSTPAITGAAAILIDIIKAEGIPYDPGMIKTAIMLAGDGQGQDYLHMGAGVPDLGTAYEIIKAAPTNDSGFPIMLWAISELNVPYFQTMTQGFHAEIYVKSVSSTPWEDKAPVLSGTITQIASLNTTPLTDPWEKNFRLTFDVPDDTPVGDYEGKITFETAKGVIAETLIKVKVLEGSKKIFYAKLHTNWDIDYSLGQYIYFLEDLKNKGVAVNEFVRGEITAELLEGYDAIWFPDPVMYGFPNYPSTKAVTEKALTDAEIQVIQDFVANGGGLFIDLLGNSLYENLVTGNNITMLNELIAPYDIEISESPYNFDKPEIATIKTLHTLTENVKKIDHYGTTLIATGNAVELTDYNGGATAAAFENENGGRVVVCTTNFFIDTEGYLENYNDGTQNAIFANNIFNWLLADNKVVVSTTKTDSAITFDITVIPSSASITAVLEVTDETGATTNETINLSSTGTGKYEYILTMENDGIFTMIITSSDDKYIGSFIKDNSPPILIGSGWENGTVL
ncbi:MAG: S8 family peptidase [Candidatus Heimdallarchaeaceae archaeon]